jgi:hypothetical protein
MSFTTSPSFTTYELVDTFNLQYLLNSFKLRQWDATQKNKEYPNRYDILPNLDLFKSCIIDGKIKIEYSLDKFGRYKNSNTINGFSYTNMFGMVRNLLTNKYYVDLDIKNCHPVIIYNLCIKHNIKEYKMLKHFIDNREELLKYIVENNTDGHMNEERIEGSIMNRDVAKRFTLMFFFGASLTKKMNEFNISELPDWFNDFFKELQKIIDSINKLECYKPIVEYVKEKKGDDTDNIRGSIFSHIIQNEERQIFDILKFELEKESYEVGAYIYDGCHIRNNKELSQSTIETLNKKLTSYFEIDNALQIELIIKKMELDKSYLEVDNQYKLYQKYKQNLEDDNIYKINSPFCFHNGNAKKNSNHMPLISQEELLKIYKNYGDIHMTTMKKPRKFIEMWLDDKFIKTYDKMVFCPNPKDPDYNKSNVLNSFTGLEINKHNYDDIPTTQKERKEYCKEIFDYIKRLSNDDDDNITFITNYISSVLSKPWKKTRVYPLFKGENTGLGKTTLFYLLRAIMGSKYCLQTSSLEDEIFGKHSMGRKDKLLILLDELSYNETKKYTEKMKTAITSDTMNVEPKGINNFEYDSYENYLGASNNDIPVELTQQNRRVRIMDTDKCNYGNSEEKKIYFDNLYSIIGDKDKEPNYKILRCFYDYMLNHDIDNYNFEANVNSKSTLNIAKKPIIDEFLNDYLYVLYNKNCNFKEEKDLSYTFDEIYKEFCKYVERMKLQNVMSGTLFGTKIKKFNFVNVKRTNKGMIYKFDTLEYCKYFNYDSVEVDMS